MFFRAIAEKANRQAVTAPRNPARDSGPRVAIGSAPSQCHAILHSPRPTPLHKKPANISSHLRRTASLNENRFIMDGEYNTLSAGCKEQIDCGSLSMTGTQKPGPDFTDTVAGVADADAVARLMR